MALKHFASQLVLSGKSVLRSPHTLRPVSASLRHFSSVGFPWDSTRKPNKFRRFPPLLAEDAFGKFSIVAGPKVQAPAPHFEGTAVVGSDFQTIKLNDFAGKYLYLFFYPLDFTFVCPTEIIAFSEKMDEFEKLNTAVVGCSCDSHFSHLAWTQLPRKKGGLGELKYPLLADYKKTIARDYNVLLENEGCPLRGSFLIDPKGIIRQITVNDLPVGRSVDETLRLIKAFQFVDTHGEVCPANWDPEKKSATIKPNPKGSKDYFEKSN